LVLCDARFIKESVRIYYTNDMFFDVWALLTASSVPLAVRFCKELSGLVR
jgi:hypothetical protein